MVKKFQSILNNKPFVPLSIKLEKEEVKRIKNLKRIELNKYKKVLNEKRDVTLKEPKYNSWSDIISLLSPSNQAFRTISFENVDGNETIYTISRNNIDNITNILKNGLTAEEILTKNKSDGELYIYLEIEKPKTIKVGYLTREFLLVQGDRGLEKKRQNRLKQGAFFKYIHNLPINLERYQIYSGVIINEELDNCLIHAFKMSGKLTDEQINNARLFIKVEMVPRKCIKEIAEKLKIKIVVSEYEYPKTYTYGDKESNIEIKLNLADDHYFLNDNLTNITSYALEHYNEIKDIKDFHKIEKVNKDGKYKKSNNRNISSMLLVQFLLQNKDKYLTQITDDIFKNNKIIKPTLENLNYDLQTETFPMMFEGKRDMISDKIDLLFFDFETTTDSEIHKPYLVNTYRVNSTKPDQLIKEFTYEGEECGLLMLQSLKQDTIIFAHNLKYDFQFVFKYLFADQLCERDGRIMGGHSLFYNKFRKTNIKVYLRDTYLMITDKLSDFPKMFFSKEEQKTIKKEVMPYEAYNTETIKQKSISIEYAKSFLKSEDDKQQLENNIKEWELEEENESFNHIAYSKIYCRQDVTIMMKGYMTFRKWMLDVTGLDIINYLTLASVSYDYLIKEGCFNGCQTIGGVPRQFIQQCVVGGRTMISQNKKNHVNKRVQDFDAVSLYPSAMYRMGFLKGSPKVLLTTDYEVIKNYDGYFIEINITKINKHRKFPLINKVNDEGIRQFKNNLLGVHCVDKVTLEDFIEFHDIEFNVVRGYYFDEGKNYKIKEVMKMLFEERKKKKAEGNPIQTTYKLIMNASYGKTILKYDPHTIKYISSQVETLKYVTRNYYNVNRFVKINGCDKFRIYENKIIDDHFSCPHIGAEILSMSKRIMNEVMCLADDLQLNIYYQDTDSMHIDAESIDLLEACYFMKYNRDLIGSKMGQFHSDFDFKCDEGHSPVSIESIYCGKKSYIDKVECVVNNKKVINYHYRLKGIPRKNIDHVVKNNYDGDYMKLYKDLLNKKTIEFDLVQSGVKFEFTNNFTVKSKKEFIRTVSF